MKESSVFDIELFKDYYFWCPFTSLLRLIGNSAETRDVHPSKPIIHIAYSPLFPQNLKIPLPYFRKINKFPYYRSIYFSLLNLCFFLLPSPPYFDHDALTHHALHVGLLDAPAREFYWVKTISDDSSFKWHLFKHAAVDFNQSVEFWADSWPCGRYWQAYGIMGLHLRNRPRPNHRGFLNRFSIFNNISYEFISTPFSIISFYKKALATSNVRER